VSLWHDARALFERAREYWLQDIWARRDYESLPFLTRLRITASRAVYIVVASFLRDRIKLRAAALTYVSLLSLVPALVVGVSLFSAFGGLEGAEAKLKSFVVDTIAVQSQREVLLGYMNQLMAKGQAAKLGVVGMLPLLLTVVSLLSNIELSFNDIWGVQKNRSFLQRFQVYWPLITLLPILFGVSISATSAFEESMVGQAIYAIPGMSLTTHLVRVVLTCLFFTFLYKIMPNTRVRLRNAAVGGFVAGSLWLIAENLYAVYAANAITYSALYGSLGAVPLFVIWVYVSWIVTLLGAMLTFAIQSAKTYEPDRAIAVLDREYVAVRLMVSAAERFAKGEHAVTAQELVDEVAVPPRVARQLLGVLVRHGLLAETVHDEDVGFVPARPLENIFVADVVRSLREDRDVTRIQVPENDAVGTKVFEQLSKANQDGERDLTALSLSALLEDTGKKHLRVHEEPKAPRAASS
jgi:membrane protein